MKMFDTIFAEAHCKLQAIVSMTSRADANSFVTRLLLTCGFVCTINVRVLFVMRIKKIVIRAAREYPQIVQ